MECGLRRTTIILFATTSLALLPHHLCLPVRLLCSVHLGWYFQPVATVRRKRQDLPGGAAMPGAKLPAVRLPSAVDEEGRVPTPGVVELPASSKFGFAWPAEAPPIVQAPLSSDRAVSLSSSEGESDHSEAENTSGLQSQTDHSDENEPTPTVHRSLKSEQQILTEKMVKAPSIPRFSRAVSMPLLSTLGHLQNPRRPSHSSHTSNCSISEVPPEYSQFHELSLELADSVQMMVQTLLQISPSQVFDPTKEQFSACSLSVPTPCISAMFTSMKNLNYISANMATFCAADSSRDSGLDPSSEPHGTPIVPSTVPDDFDIGELLQSVGDTLSGAAAQVGVDLVLYHGDVGMKHVAVKGDECGISYALSHVSRSRPVDGIRYLTHILQIVRQVINTARRGDSIEIGLSVGILPSKSRDAREPDTTPNSESIPQGPASPSDGPLSCSFDITHNFASSDTSSANEPSRGLPQPPGAVLRPSPTFNMLILQRLLSQVGASLSCDLQPKKLVGGRSCELTLTLERGLPSVIGTRTALSKEDVSYQLLSGVRIAEEPTLEELAQFAETLRGRKVTLYASSKGSFARHLTSYLTAWGLDVSHVSAESSMDGNAPQSDSSQGSSQSVTGQRMLGGSFLQSVPYGIGLEAFSQAIPHQMPPPTPSAAPRPTLPSGLSFVFIDDDVTVLRERLRKLRLQQAYPLTLSRKRPPLATHHRPRSTPQVQRVGGMGTSLAVVIVHFTSLTNYKLVKEVIQSDLASHPGATSTVPEVMIIPKPAGPRRFLTALHTAVTKPIVDPFFTPIATSPITTGQASFFSLNTSNTRTPSPKSPTASSRPSRTNSDRSTKSPKETSGEPANLPPPSPLNISDSMEYFSEAAAKLGASPSSGLVIQSPSGQPAGIFFHPKGKGKVSSAMERERGQFLVPSEQAGAATARRISNGKEAKSPRSPHSPMSFSSLHSVSVIPVSNPLLDIESQPAPAGPSKSKGKKPGSPRMESTPVPTSPRRGSSISTTSTSTKVATPPTSSGNETANTSPMSRRNARRSAGELTPQAGLKGPTDTNIVVPPISVLIVDGLFEFSLSTSSLNYFHFR